MSIVSILSMIYPGSQVYQDEAKSESSNDIHKQLQTADVPGELI